MSGIGHGADGEVTVLLPFPPSANNLFTQGIVRGKVRRFPSASYRKWRKAAGVYLLAAKLPRFTAPVVIKLQLVPRDARARDADNYNKAVIDALVEARIIPGDDARWVKSVVAWWENPSDEPGVIVTIRPAKAARRPALNAHERKMLADIRRAGPRLVLPGYSANAIRSLVAKGYVRPLPGLLEDCPQGYALVE